MTDEEKQTIRYCKNCLTKMILGQNPCFTIDTLETILKLIEKQQKEIEYWKKAFQREYEDNGRMSTDLIQQDLVIRKKDKIIDLMVGILWDYDYLETYNGDIKDSKEKIKQYFEKEASKDE